MLRDALGRELEEADRCSVEWVLQNVGADPNLESMFLGVITSPAFLAPD